MNGSQEISLHCVLQAFLTIANYNSIFHLKAIKKGLNTVKYQDHAELIMQIW